MEDESLEEDEGRGGKKKKGRGATPAAGISGDERMGRTEKGSTVEVLKQVRFCFCLRGLCLMIDSMKTDRPNAHLSICRRAA